LAAENKPKMIVCGGSAYPREIDFERFRKIADSIDAYLMADVAHPAGLIAAKVHSDPIPHCHFVTSTTHKTLRGPRGGMTMSTEEFSKNIAKEVFPGIQGGPMMHVIAAKAVAFQEVLQPGFITYAKQVKSNCTALAAQLKDRGYTLVSGGTDNHLLLIDLRNKGLTGKGAEKALDRAGITANKNMVPYDDQSPFVTSGIRLGTPAVTTRGMKESDMGHIAEWIDQVLQKPEDEETAKRVHREIVSHAEKFPIYADLYVA